MGVLQRFERRLETMVEGAFAKVFKGEVQPVEIAQALQRETDDKKAIVGQGRILVPNDFVVELGNRDYRRLEPYAEPLTQELAAMVREHAAEQAYSFVGNVRVALELVEELDTGIFRIRSGVTGGASVEGSVMETASSGATSAESAPPPPDALPGSPRLTISHGEQLDRMSPEGRGAEEAYFLTKPVTVIGRGHDADVRLNDPRVSRRHAELRFSDGAFVLRDLGSTNGTLVNDTPIDVREVDAGDRIGVGATTLIFDRSTDA